MDNGGIAVRYTNTVQRLDPLVDVKRSRFGSLKDTVNRAEIRVKRAQTEVKRHVATLVKYGISREEISSRGNTFLYAEPYYKNN